MEQPLQQDINFTTMVTTLQNLVIAVNKLNTTLTATLEAVLPVVQSTATSATAGTNGAVPAQVFEYLVVTDPSGNTVKVPAFKV